MSTSRCECRDEVRTRHRGRTRAIRIDINVQPPGHGSYTAPATIRVCEAHAARFLESHLNAWLVLPEETP